MMMMTMVSCCDQRGRLNTNECDRISLLFVFVSVQQIVSLSPSVSRSLCSDYCLSVSTDRINDLTREFFSVGFFVLLLLCVGGNRERGKIPQIQVLVIVDRISGRKTKRLIVEWAHAGEKSCTLDIS